MSNSLHDLIQRHLEGLCLPAESAELSRLLREDPHAAIRFAESTRLHAELEASIRGEELLQEAQALLYRDAQKAAASPGRGRSFRWWVAGAAAAAVLVVGGILFHHYHYLTFPPDPLPVAAAGGPIKVLAGSVVVDGATPRTFRYGATLDVQSGPAVLRLSDGSRLTFAEDSKAVVHGPAAGTRQLIELLRGSVMVEVTPGDGTFLVEGAMWRVTALDTDFRVELFPAENMGETTMQARASFLAVAVLTGLVQVDFCGEPSVLAAGEQSTFFADVKDIEKGKEKNAQVRGTISAVDAKTLTIAAGESGAKSRTYNLTADVSIIIDGKPAKTSDLKTGMIVVAALGSEKTEVKEVRVEGGSVGGDVRAVDAASHKITVAAKGKDGQPAAEKSYTVSGDAKIIVDGKPARLADVKTGAPAFLRLSADGKTAVAVVQGGKGTKDPPDQPKGRLFNGEIKMVDVSAGSVTLAGAKDGSERTFKLAPNAVIQINGKPAKLEEVKTGMRASVKLGDDEKTVVGLSAGQKDKEKPSDKNK